MDRVRLFLALAAFVVTGAAQTPSVGEGGVVNAASFAGSQAITPGSLVSIFGTELASGLSLADSIPLSTSLGGVSVTFNGIQAPLVFASPGQINAQLPWNVLPAGANAGAASVVVTRGNVSSQPRNVPVGQFSPGIFSVQFGIGQAIAINADGSLAAREGSIPGLATRPARIGDTIIILATGLGAVDPPAQTGNNSLDALRRTRTAPTVLIGGRQAEVPFSGLSPQFVGVNQLNVVIPAGVPPGDAVPLQIRLGDITTTDRVTIAVAN